MQLRPGSLARPAQPNEPEGGPARRLQCLLPDQPVPGRALHEPAAPWVPDEPDIDPLWWPRMTERP